LIHALLNIKSSPVGIGTERAIAGLLMQLQALEKLGKLPIAYTEALGNHMIGLFNVKFSSLWLGASRSLVALSDAQHNTLCEVTSDALERFLRKVSGQQ
jgi:hypothetical protein